MGKNSFGIRQAISVIVTNEYNKEIAKKRNFINK
jgi:hypothetical protein